MTPTEIAVIGAVASAVAVVLTKGIDAAIERTKLIGARQEGREDREVLMTEAVFESVRKQLEDSQAMINDLRAENRSLRIDFETEHAKRLQVECDLREEKEAALARRSGPEMEGG